MNLPRLATELESESLLALPLLAALTLPCQTTDLLNSRCFSVPDRSGAA